MQTYRKNELRMIVRSTLYATAGLCISGTLIQTFLGEIGLTGYIYLHTALLQGTNMLSTVLFSHFADDNRHLIRRATLVQLPMAIFFLLYIPLCVSETPSLTAFLLAAGIGIAQTFFGALHTVCDYKMPYQIIPVEEYGRMSAFSGIIIALTSLGVGAIMTRLSKAMPYARLMAYVFPIAAGMLLLSALITLTLQPIEEAAAQTDHTGQKVPFKALLKTPVFYMLIFPNLCRSIANGAVSVLAGIALERGFDATLTTRMVTLQSAAMLVTCLLFGVFSKKVEPRKTIFIGSLMMLTLPILGFCGQWMFLLIFTVAFAGRNLVDYAVPAALYRVVPDAIAGPYNAWRMVLQAGGTMLGSFLAGVVSIPVLLVGAAALQLVCGLVYGGKRWLQI